MIRVEVLLSRIFENARQIAAQTGVALWPVIKADAYGLGTREIARALANVADGFCVFALNEAIAADIWNQTGKPSLALGPAEPRRLQEYLIHHVRPSVIDVPTATALREAHPALCLDTGMQRFTCSPSEAPAVIEAGNIAEVFTHATRMEHVNALQQWAAAQGRKLMLHAAATAMLGEPRAWLDAVRPGLGLYTGAVRITAPLIETHTSQGPVGYTGFTTVRHGVIPVGYTDGLRRGQCRINRQPRRILEVGMQTAFVEISEHDQMGDLVTLLDDHLTPAEIAKSWGSSPQEVLLSLTRTAQKTYLK